jgi:ABC-type transport system involved in multi-copper enzyme maturation permease subunit
MAFGILLKNAFKSWFGPKGIILLLVAAAFPAILTGAWVVTHLADPAAVSLSWDPVEPQQGEEVNFTGVIRNDGRASTGDFNATVSLWRAIGIDPFTEDVIFARPVNRTEPVPSLSPGEEITLSFSWTPQNQGGFAVFLVADPDDEVGEVEDSNNVIGNVILVGAAVQGPDEAPEAPQNLTGVSSASEMVDANVTEIRIDSLPLRPDEEARFEAIIANDGPTDLREAEVVVQVGTARGNQLFPSQTMRQVVNVSAGETANVTLTWPDADPGSFWVQAYVNVSANQTDGVAENNFLTRAFVVNPGPLGDIERPELPERLTIKSFYLQVLLLHFWIIVPFIALFFAGGVVSDEKSEGNLVYLLTRPIPRFMIPLSKFVAGFVTGAVAVSLANVAAFLILFGFGAERDIGYLTTPLIASLLAFFAYMAIFTFLGVIFERPYVVGILYILVWEALGLFDSLLQSSNIDVQIEVADWVENFTVIFNLGKALETWPLDQGFVFLPEAEAAVSALRNIVVAGLVFLVLACIVMQMRQFDV